MSKPLEKYSPIAIFAYRRPRHLQEVLEALKLDPLAKLSSVLVFSDGARSEDDAEDVEAVRAYLQSVTGFLELTIIKREINYGLANNIIAGVSEVCRSHGSVIVLEDDVVVAKGFLKFMNDALTAYRSDCEVMHISGASFINHTDDGSETYFLRLPLCWGWATWDESWRLFRRDDDVLERLNREEKDEMNFGGTYNFWSQAEQNLKKEIRTWFIYWYATIIYERGLCLFPCRSLVNNIGFDGSGENSKQDSGIVILAKDHCPEVRRLPLRVSESGRTLQANYFRSLRPPLRSRIIKKARALWKLVVTRIFGE